ncbi:transposase, IS605 OrfB family, partial [mine drainage metagenome]
NTQGSTTRRKTVVWRDGKEREVPWATKDLLTWAESVTVRTKDHPKVLCNFAEICPQMPVILRRAAINAASGAVRGHLTNHRIWAETDPAKRGKEPNLPDPQPNLTLYAGMYELDEAGLRKGSGRLKVFTAGRWRWIDLPVHMPPYALDLFARSEVEQARIAAERTEQNARMTAEGRELRSDTERERLRSLPGVWVAQSPTVIVKREGVFL